MNDVVVASAMHPQVLTCPADVPLRTVAAIMAAERVHCVVVEPIERDGAGWGIISDRDLMMAAAGGRSEETAGSAAASEFLTVTPDESLGRAVQIMVEHDTSHLVVVDPRTNRALGVISTFDVARTLAAG
jgi:CBS domain-containing protein